MRMVSLASGSSGNSIYIEGKNTKILVDVGISKKKIVEGLSQIGVRPEELDALLITHEHMDHIRGLGIMARAYHLPIYLTEGSKRAIEEMEALGEISSELFVPICSEIPFFVREIQVEPFSVEHDAAEPVAFRFSCEEKSLAVLTDLGCYDHNLIRHFSHLDAILLEANHDRNMVEVGPYPYYLKQRILGEKGHLSNEDAGRLLTKLLNPRLSQVLLGHLSKENNYEALAVEAVRLELLMGKEGKVPEKISLAVAPRSFCSPIIEI